MSGGAIFVGLVLLIIVRRWMRRRLLAKSQRAVIDTAAAAGVSATLGPDGLVRRDRPIGLLRGHEGM